MAIRLLAVGTIAIRPVAILLCNLRQPGHRNHPLVLVDPEDHDARAAAPRDADVVDRDADHHAGIRYEHDLVIMPDREDRDDRVLPPAQLHLVDTLPTARGDPV